MLKRGLIWISIGYAFNLAETAFFGWNATAQSCAERFCDNISAGILLVGLFVLAGYAAGKTVMDELCGADIKLMRKIREKEE